MIGEILVPHVIIDINRLKKIIPIKLICFLSIILSIANVLYTIILIQLKHLDIIVIDNILVFKLAIDNYVGFY